METRTGWSDGVMWRPGEGGVTGKLSPGARVGASESPGGGHQPIRGRACRNLTNQRPDSKGEESLAANERSVLREADQ